VLAEEKSESMPQREGKRNALFAVNGSTKRFFSGTAGIYK
jgi:hypothetical protein